MGYDLSRYEQLPPPAASEPPADRASGWSPEPAGPTGQDPVPAGLGDPVAPASGVDGDPGRTPSPEPDEPGLGSVFRRFRRRGGRHRP
jgi:hypothetical protein